MNCAKINTPGYKSYPLLRFNFSSLAELGFVINRKASYVSRRFNHPKICGFNSCEQTLILNYLKYEDTRENRDLVFEEGRLRGVEYQEELETKGLWKKE